jgi:hypothetical protein
MENLHPYIVEEILAMAMKLATPVETVRLAAVNKYTSSFLSPEVRKQAIGDKIMEDIMALSPEVRKRAISDKMIKIIKQAKCKKNSVKLLQKGCVTLTITLTVERILLFGNLNFSDRLQNMECSSKSITPKVKAVLKEIIEVAKYNIVRVNNKDVHDDTLKLAALFKAAKQ